MNGSELEQAITHYKTPFYIFDMDLLAAQVKKLRMILDSDVELCYAMKANPFLIKELEEQVDYFEVCSPGEFHICENAAIPMNKIVMSGVYKNPEDMKTALDSYGSAIIYTIESRVQWDILEQYSKNQSSPLQVLLRLTNGNQFGMDKKDIEQIIASHSPDSPLQIIGIQYFSGTQKKAVSKLKNELEMLDTFCCELYSQYKFTVQKLEYGPGLPAYYFQEETNEELLILDALAEQLHNLKFSGKITLEIGRFLAAPCGSYVTRVVDLKINKNQSYCIVDGGMHHFNYYGQMMAMKKPPIIHWKEGNGVPKEWTVCGSLCTANDVLVKQYPLIDLKLGDTLIFEKTGAYSVTEGMSLFLSRDLPQVFFYSRKNQFQLARDTFPTYTLNYKKK